MTKTSVVKSIDAQNIILVGKGTDEDSRPANYVEYVDKGFQVKVAPCTESFYALAKADKIQREKTQQFVLHVNGAGDVYSYDSARKAKFSFMEEGKVDDKEMEATTSDMIVTVEAATGEINLIHPLPNLTSADQAAIRKAVELDADSLVSNDVILASKNLVILEVRERRGLKSFYIG